MVGGWVRELDRLAYIVPRWDGVVIYIANIGLRWLVLDGGVGAVPICVDTAEINTFKKEYLVALNRW